MAGCLAISPYLGTLGTQPSSPSSQEQLPHAATADGNPAWSGARLDHFLSNTREGRQNRPTSEKKGGKKQKTQEEHDKVGEGKKDKQQIIYKI